MAKPRLRQTAIAMIEGMAEHGFAQPGGPLMPSPSSILISPRPD